MSKKKLLWIIILLVTIAVVVAMVIVMNNASKVQKESENIENKNLTAANRTVTEIQTNKEYTKIQLDDGILYTNTGKKETADLVIGTNYFDTTITDIYYNSANYMDKKIEIEGFYMLNDSNDPYTFVARYSTNSLCPNCPSGYSALEYQLNGNIDETFKEEETWIKVIGYLEKGDDEYYGEYFYLNVLNLEIMNEKGEMTVSN